MPSPERLIFTSVRLPFGWLGNMAPYPLAVDGDTWRTSEALFQAMRFEDALTRDMIRTQKSPMAAKMLAKRCNHMMVVEPRTPEDVANMEIVLRLKLEQHPDLLKLLRATGDTIITEDVSARPSASGLFWGAALRSGAWDGRNMLGELWMKLRAELV